LDLSFVNNTEDNITKVRIKFNKNVYKLETTSQLIDEPIAPGSSLECSLACDLNEDFFNPEAERYIIQAGIKAEPGLFICNIPLNENVFSTEREEQEQQNHVQNNEDNQTPEIQLPQTPFGGEEQLIAI